MAATTLNTPILAPPSLFQAVRYGGKLHCPLGRPLTFLPTYLTFFETLLMYSLEPWHISSHSSYFCKDIGPQTHPTICIPTNSG